MVPRSAPKALFVVSRVEVPQKVSASDTFLRTFGATWAILGAIWGPAGRQGAHKIELFGTKSHQNLKK